MPRKKKQPVKKVVKKKASAVKKKVVAKPKPKVEEIKYYWEIVSLETGDDNLVDRIVYELHGKLGKKIVEQTAAMDVLPQSALALIPYKNLGKDAIIQHIEDNIRPEYLDTLKNNIRKQLHESKKVITKFAWD